MDDLISRAEVMQRLGITDMDCHKCELRGVLGCVMDNGFVEACTVICKAPTVDAIPVEWMLKWKDSGVTEESADRLSDIGGDFVEWMIAEWRAEHDKIY